jgi:hypothetical protein
MLKSLFNLNSEPGKPDFVIKKKGEVTEVFIDSHTKFDMIINSLLNVS